MKQGRFYHWILTGILSGICILPAKAQIVGSDVFLQGLFVEVGINQCAAYGSEGGAPAGYHPTESGLGFVADWESDGWDTGTPDYCGDYFVPGSPVEGWQVQVGTDVWTNTDQFCSPDEIPGDITSYEFADGVYTAVWEGDIASENLAITQTTRLPEDKLYFTTEITFCNEGATDLVDVYYNRNVDPDNDQPWSGSFTTVNTIVSQPIEDSVCDALVTSEGQTYGCFLGLGARDYRARVSWGNFSTTAGTPQNVYEGTGGYSSSGTNTNDIANSIAFYIPLIEAGECEIITFAYVLSIDDLEEALDATTAFDLSVNSEVVSSGDTAYYCNPLDSMHLEILGGEDYIWEWSPSTYLDVDTGHIVNFVSPVTQTLIANGVGLCGEVTLEVTLLVDTTVAISDAGDDEPICIGSETTLNGDGSPLDDLYLWVPATGLSDPNIANPVASPTTTTTYTLITTNQYGCPAVDDVTITVNPLPDVDAGPDQEFCVDGVIVLDASGAVDYEWSPAVGLSDPGIADPECTVDENTTYTVTGTDANGCVNTDDVFISVNYLPDVDAIASPYTIDVFLGETSTLDVLTGGISFVWSPPTGLSDPNSQNPVVSGIPDTIVYTVTVTDINGCVSTDTVQVNAIGELVVGLPTAFSPNGDGYNDFYAPVLDGSGDLEYFAIYNRWGQLVFESNTATLGWDGMFNGKEAELGSYVVYARARTSLDEQREYSGYFTLVR